MRGSYANIFHVVVLAVGLSALTIGQASTQSVLTSPASGPCAAGASYEPACDVDHDGDVDIFDIQKTAGHWNQTGPWVSDNNHNHLGQTWTGNNNPLTIDGSFGSPGYAALVLSNSAFADGLHIDHAGATGVKVYSTGAVGLYIGATGTSSSNGDGIHICLAGGGNSCLLDLRSNGVEIGYAAGNGLRVMSADVDGVSVQAAGSNGVFVGSAGAHGVYAQSTNGSYNGVYGINSGGGNGVRGDSNGGGTSGVYGENTGGGFGVAGRVINGGRAIYGDGGSGWAGWFDGNVTINGACVGCLQANFAVNAGQRALRPGDVVSVRAVAPADFDNASALWEVLPVQSDQAAAGVVAGRATLVAEAEHLPAETGRRLVPRDGVAQPGEYVTIVYSGPMQVRLMPDEAAIAAGTRVTAAADGRVRPLQTRVVAGMVVAEGVPVLGVALEETVDGLVWVLVNPQ